MAIICYLVFLVVLACGQETRVNLNSEVSLTLGTASSQKYYLDIPMLSQHGILSYLKVVWTIVPGKGQGFSPSFFYLNFEGFLKSTLTRGSGSLFSLTLPGGNWYEQSGDITSETVPG